MNNQFDENLPELINAGNHFISIYINTDDCSMEFSTEQPDSSDNLYYYSWYILHSILRLKLTQ